MKRWLLLFIFIIILAGCGEETNETDAKESKEEEPVEDQAENTNENSNEASEDEDTESESKDDQKQSEDDSEQSSKQNEPEKKLKPLYEMNDVWSFEPIEDAPSEVVLLTIDDGPDGQALEMAKTLKDLDASAIFFVNGIFMEDDESKEVVRKIHEMGFSIGNHTYSHQNLSEVSQEKQREEILSLNELIMEITGEKPEFFRAPHGVNTDFAEQLVEDEGMLLMNWSYGYDFKQGYLEKEAIADIMVNTDLLTDGANLLMHDREWTNAALKDIVQGLRNNGYEMLNPDEILLPTNR